VKIIIFKNHENRVWLNLDKIQRLFSHKFMRYTQTVIYLSTNYTIEIYDPYHRDFNELLHNFIMSDEKIEIIKVEEIACRTNHVDITMIDWISQAMGKVKVKNESNRI
jgi:hypothetical protein